MELSFWVFVGLGFVAQMIDGGVGMGFGIITNTVLISLGISPVVSSGSVHTVSVFTSMVSGASHWRLGNVSGRLFKRLLLPGVAGALAGALLMRWLPVDLIKVLVSVYLLVIGTVILYRAVTMRDEHGLLAQYPPFAWLMQHFLNLLSRWHLRKDERVSPKVLRPLGAFSGMLDALGGGGWGPMVTSTLILKGAEPRYSVGSTNSVEFFVNVTVAIVLFSHLPDGAHLQMISGLLLGGIVAAPLGAYALRYFSRRTLFYIIGTVMVGLTLFRLVDYLFV